MEKHKFTMSIWEDNEYIIEKDGKPIGSTITKTNAESILLWLETSGL